MLTACQVPVTSPLPIRSIASSAAATCLELPCGNQLIRLALTDIVRLEGAGNYTYIYTRDRRRYLSSKTLKRLEAVLPGPAFCRVHKSALINLDYLTRINFRGTPQLLVQDSESIVISRRRLGSTRRQVKQYQRLLSRRNLVA